MTALGKIRSKGILLIIIIGLGLFAFIAEEAFRSCNGIKGQNSQQIGEVLGEKIYVQDFQKLLEEYQDAMKLTMRTDNLSEDQLNQLKDQVWQQLVSERVMKEDCKKLGLTVTEDELQNVLNDGTNQLLTQTPFVNQQTGRFDVSILKQFIDAYRKAEASNNSQQLDQMRPAYNYWLFVEKNLRTQLLAQKYQSLLANCVLSNKVEAKMAFNEENEEAQIQLASIAYNTIKDADIKVTDEELKAKYEELKPAFRQQQETRDVKMVDVQVKASATDRAQLQKDMAGYQKQLAASADHTQVVSKSGSMIQYIGLPVSGKAFQQYPDIASKIDSMAVGTTGVVENTKDNTYNIVRILSRTELPDSVEFRQIQVGGKTLEAARASADSIQKALAAGGDFQAIAKRYGLTLEEMYDLNTELEEYLTALRQQQLGYDPDSVILPDSGTPAEEWNARLEDISVNGETPLETAINNGMVLYMGLLYWPEDLPDGAAEELAAAAGDNNALYRLQYGITDETAEAPADEAPTDAATGDTADSTDPATPAEDAESGETTTGTPMQTISLIPLEQVPLQGDEELLVVQMDVELGIQVTRRETYMANVQFGTTYQDNNKKPIGDTSTISAGIYGQDEVVADVTYIDGVRVGETVLSRTRLKDPVNQVIARGTQTIDDYFASTGGRFIWPADGGYFYGSLGSYGGHTGMDIACPLGTTVRASKAGTVTTALNYGWNYGYGKTVVINHGYGQITRYAHMSNVTVTVGQYVKQGQVIGYSGSTGNSTGPHLHFEIRIDGAIKAPENYIGKVYNR